MKELTTYEYGAMSSKFSCVADNKLTAYVTMVAHYDGQAYLLVIYSPDDSKKDNWTSFTGEISKTLDDIFGGDGAFDKYAEDHIEEIKACFDTVKRIV